MSFGIVVKDRTGVGWSVVQLDVGIIGIKADGLEDPIDHMRLGKDNRTVGVPGEAGAKVMAGVFAIMATISSWREVERPLKPSWSKAILVNLTTA